MSEKLVRNRAERGTSVTTATKTRSAIRATYEGLSLKAKQRLLTGWLKKMDSFWAG